MITCDHNVTWFWFFKESFVPLSLLRVFCELLLVCFSRLYFILHLSEMRVAILTVSDSCSRGEAEDKWVVTMVSNGCWVWYGPSVDVACGNVSVGIICLHLLNHDDDLLTMTLIISQVRTFAGISCHRVGWAGELYIVCKWKVFVTDWMTDSTSNWSI